eukprot:GEZU01013709.1.p1 GENE.GEZU01013709.1~~GEZU01013709.1.p1  ORF type:complete len:232 (+),score=63.60 GEZU01013709.1:286-981(+)
MCNTVPNLQKKGGYTEREKEILVVSLRKLQGMLKETQHGIQDYEQTWDTIMQNSDDDSFDISTCEDFLLELIRESNPRFGELGEELTEIITLENTMLDIIEDVQSFLEKEIQTFADPASVLASNSNKPQSLMSAFIRNNYGQGADNKQRKVPLRGEGKGSYGAQLSRFLQINDHFNRVCECNKLIVTIRKILIRTENYNSKIELIHERMKDFLPQYQTSLSCLNDTLRQIH